MKKTLFLTTLAFLGMTGFIFAQPGKQAKSTKTSAKVQPATAKHEKGEHAAGTTQHVHHSGAKHHTGKPATAK